MKKDFAVTLISILFIFLFIYAAISKLLAYNDFIVQLGQSPLLTAYAGTIAWLIPLLETGIAIFLALPPIRLLGLYFSFSLMILFTAYIIAITQFSENIPCSCGGVLQKMTWNQHLLFNIVFVLLALTGIILHDRQAILKNIFIAINRRSRKPEQRVGRFNILK